VHCEAEVIQTAFDLVHTVAKSAERLHIRISHTAIADQMLRTLNINERKFFELLADADLMFKL
jgi:ATP phosphoribosyltransferase regulatory subunit HisZ